MSNISAGHGDSVNLSKMSSFDRVSFPCPSRLSQGISESELYCRVPIKGQAKVFMKAKVDSEGMLSCSKVGTVHAASKCTFRREYSHASNISPLNMQRCGTTCELYTIGPTGQVELVCKECLPERCCTEKQDRTGIWGVLKSLTSCFDT